ncbi:hypothetical protein [Haloarchaeobius iranensis]|uniref:Uncharacterized protein n=1 Tax=Haloarchaeobius iranensis TaxID=996166 RepID=A0A1H0AUB3_9EURY|nr:hypothetical protein [Haloarchaeobius iranensis]SDN36974.1 hypothetical protein SAMN05192554_1306 [Haloarchaeobius iranensis]
MQRRAAAAYVVLLLVITAGAFAFISTAEGPAVSLEDPDETLQKGSTLTVNDRVYNVTDISASSGGGGGHGGGGGTTYEAALVWTNDSAQWTETWGNNSTVTYQGDTYRAFIANTSEPTEIALRWEPSDRFSPQWVDGVQYIDGEPDTLDRQATRVDTYIENSNNSSIQPRTIDTTSSLDYNGNETTITTAPEQATFTWTAPRDNEVTFGQHENVTLNGVDYAVHFTNENTVTLQQGQDAQVALYEQLDDKSRFHERINGFWGVVIVASLALVLLVTLAFLPRKE